MQHFEKLSQRTIDVYGRGEFHVTVYTDRIEVDDSEWESVFTLPNDPGDEVLICMIRIALSMFERGVESGKNIKMDEIRRALNVPAVPVEGAY